MFEDDPESAKKQVLVVDDDDALRHQITEYINRSGTNINCRSAEDGAAAIKALDEENPDLVLLDIKMPDMSGIEVAQKIAEITPQPRVILMSGYDDAVTAANQANLDVFAVVWKPVPLKVISQFLSKAFAMKASEA